MESVVKVFIYDLTKGLARSMSLPLLGKQLDGVWHSGIVAYGQEFFYGGDGISSCPPCGTILGQPDKIVELGTTQIPLDMFMDYLHDLATSAYKPQCYHLFHHNCNTFSDDVANFLTGNNIPSYVTNLPQEVLNTPFGAMIRPFVDAMSVSPGGGQELFPAAHNTAAPAAATSGSFVTGNTAGAAATKTAASSKAGNTRKSSEDKTQNIKSYNNTEVLERYQQNKDVLFESLGASSKQLLEETFEYLTTPNCDWSLGRQHINLFGEVLGDTSKDKRHKLLVSKLLQQACMREDVVVLLIHDPASTIFQLLLTLTTLDINIQTSLVKAMCNVCRQPVGLDWLCDNTTTRTLNNTESSCHRKIITDLCVSCLLHDNDDLNSVGSALASNLSQSQVFDDLAMELGIALAQLCLKPLPENTAECTFDVLWRCMQVNPEVTNVLAVMGLDLTSYHSKSGQLKQTSEKITQAIKHVL